MQGYSKTAGCDMGSSVYWGGIIGVKDDNGTDAALLSLSSASGTDYMGSFAPVAAGVPEPTTWAMMICGFDLVGSGMRRKTPKIRFA
jgi:hypothetical protein